jgi:hypothetical protein
MEKPMVSFSLTQTPWVSSNCMPLNKIYRTCGIIHCNGLSFICHYYAQSIRCDNYSIINNFKVSDVPKQTVSGLTTWNLSKLSVSLPHSALIALSQKTTLDFRGN